MKKIHRTRLLNAILYALICSVSIYTAFILPDPKSFASGRLEGFVGATIILIVVICVGLAINRYRETRNIREAFKIIYTFFVAALSIEWFKKTKKRKRKK
jgi:hypothetical protein